jgi:hypothetical protein
VLEQGGVPPRQHPPRVPHLSGGERRRGKRARLGGGGAQGAWTRGKVSKAEEGESLRGFCSVLCLSVGAAAPRQPGSSPLLRPVDMRCIVALVPAVCMRARAEPARPPAAVTVPLAGPGCARPRPPRPAPLAGGPAVARAAAHAAHSLWLPPSECTSPPPPPSPY